jgi:succinate-acetate transporter protein
MAATESAPPLRVFLQPIAPPVTLGLWGFFGSTFVISTWILGWWGNPDSPTTFFVFNAASGGVAQFLAGLWSFRARDYIASALLTMWGTYWMAYGFLVGLSVAGFFTIPPLTAPQPAFAIWFIPLGLFTLTGAVAALSKAGNFPLFALLLTVGMGCACVCGGFWTGSKGWIDVGAWLFIVGAGFAWYVAAMTLLLSAWRRVILPLGKFGRAGNVPGRPFEFPSEYVHGEPGVRQAQM